MSLLAAIVAGVFCHRAEAADADSLAFFENNVRPLLIENCDWIRSRPC
jgi:hypothetical protein